MSDLKIKKTITLVRVARDRSEPCRAEISIELRRQESCAPHLSIDLEPCERYTELGISALVWYKGDRRSDPSAAGQCIDDVRKFFGSQGAQTDIDGHVTTATIEELCDLWKRWHLNGMNAGTRAQKEKIEPVKDTLNRLDWFGAACTLLEGEGLLVDRGYKYGSAWLVEPLPEDVVKRVGEICRAFEAK